MSEGFDEVRVMFDRYIDKSLKNQTRSRCSGKNPLKYRVSDNTHVLEEG